MTDYRCPIIALVGRPNVGKSSLFNRLTKSNRAIVDPTPGVTRDRHYGDVTWNERTFLLVDTGGIEGEPAAGKAGAARIDDQIRTQTMLAVEEADVIVFMLDGRDGLLPADHEIAALLRRSEKRFFLLVNKIDGPEKEADLLMPFYELGAGSLCAISAAHGYGVAGFLDRLLEALELPEARPAEQEGVVRVACIGRPNVGKSSLINRLLGEDRMVVSDLPGTTRDSVDSMLVRGDKRYLFIDTAGIRRKGKVQEKLEKFSVMRALSTLERCELAMMIIDSEEGVTEQDTKVIGYALDRGRACLILLNKWDLLRGEVKQQQRLKDELARAVSFADYIPTLTISALTGSGCQRIFPLIDAVRQQYGGQFSTGVLNRLLQDAVARHSPPMHKGRRVKFYYVTQVSTAPPTFVLFVNYPKGVHFSYHRYLVNFFRTGLKLDRVPLRLLLRERQRRQLD